MKTRVLYSKVAGVTYEGRQAIIAEAQAGMDCMIRPEPENPHDSNALAVLVAIGGEGRMCGYIPRELASELAPYIEGESLLASVAEVTGGFEKWDGSRASFGLIVRLEIPDQAEGG